MGPLHKVFWQLCGHAGAQLIGNIAPVMTMLFSEVSYYCLLCDCTECRYFLDRLNISSGSQHELLAVSDEICCCNLLLAPNT